MFDGNAAIESLRGESNHIAGAIAMPLMIGSGRIGASVLAGQRLGRLTASFTIVTVVAVCVLMVTALEHLHDHVRPRNEELVQRSIEVAGRVTALIVGTPAIKPVVAGIGTWISKLD